MTHGRRRQLLRLAQVAGSFTIVALLIAFVLPKVTGTDYEQIWGRLRSLSATTLALMFVVWAAGLFAYTFVLVGALPGLTHAQALTLNLAGSAVSNLVPFGGAVGIAATFAMTGSWGFRPAATTLFTVVTGAWNVLNKLALPCLALIGLLVTGDITDRRLVIGATVAAAVLAVVVTAGIGVLSSERVAVFASKTIGYVGHRVLQVAGRTREVHWESAVLDFRHRALGVLRDGWITMTLGMLAYSGLQALLAWQCLHAVGSTLTVTEVFAGFAFGRLLTSFVATPSGVGVAETGAAALLAKFGGDPAASAAGILLFSFFFTYLLEIPVGAIGWLTWALYTPWRKSPA